MALINSSSFKMLAVSITMLFIAAVGVVALTAQQGPPQGGGQGMMGRPGGPVAQVVPAGAARACSAWALAGAGRWAA